MVQPGVHMFMFNPLALDAATSDVHGSDSAEPLCGPMCWHVEAGDVPLSGKLTLPPVPGKTSCPPAARAGFRLPLAYVALSWLTTLNVDA